MLLRGGARPLVPLVSYSIALRLRPILLDQLEPSRADPFVRIVHGRIGSVDPLMLALVELARVANGPVEWSSLADQQNCFGVLRVSI